MPAKKKEPSIMEVLRAIRDESSRKLMTMTREEQMAYIAEGAKWFSDKLKKKPVRAKRQTAARPVAARKTRAARKVVASSRVAARKAK